MSKIIESLKANQAEILAALPEEFHEEFKSQLEEPQIHSTSLSEEEEVEAIKAELFANPYVDENLAADELKEIKAPERIAPVSDEEAKAEEARLLAEAKAGIDANS